MKHRIIILLTFFDSAQKSQKEKQCHWIPKTNPKKIKLDLNKTKEAVKRNKELDLIKPFMYSARKHVRNT